MSARGLLGGTFDPIHLGHLILAETARETFNLEKVIFVPAGDPPHKPGLVMAPAHDRLRMVEIATAANPYFLASPVEVERPGPSYTVDTVTALRAGDPALEWCLILGSDTLTEIPTWHDYHLLLPMVTILTAERPGTPLVIPAELCPWAGSIRFFYPPTLNISSTRIRERIQQGLSLRYLLPEEVAAYIGERRIYQSGDRVKG